LPLPFPEHPVLRRPASPVTTQAPSLPNTRRQRLRRKPELDRNSQRHCLGSTQERPFAPHAHVPLRYLRVGAGGLVAPLNAAVPSGIPKSCLCDPVSEELIPPIRCVVTNRTPWLTNCPQVTSSLLRGVRTATAPMDQMEGILSPKTEHSPGIRPKPRVRPHGAPSLESIFPSAHRVRRWDRSSVGLESCCDPKTSIDRNPASLMERLAFNG
jgi:hypothetical protein